MFFVANILLTQLLKKQKFDYPPGQKRYKKIPFSCPLPLQWHEFDNGL
jgi:hypothetical protein